MYGPLLRLEGVRVDNGWNEALALNYERLHFHINFWEAMGRRLRLRLEQLSVRSQGLGGWCVIRNFSSANVRRSR